MRIDWWTLGLQTVNALVLIALLAHYLFRPIAKIIADRQAAASQLLSEALDVRIGAEGERDIAERTLAGLAAQRASAVKSALTEAEKEKSATLAAAHAEAERLRTQALADIERARKASEREQDERAGRLAVAIAARLFERLPDEARVRGFESGLARALSDLPAETRAGFGENGAPAILRAPRALSANELESCRRALAEALGRPLELTVEIAPELVAGLELEDRHAAIRNSLSADLAKIAAELAAHEDARAR